MPEPAPLILPFLLTVREFLLKILPYELRWLAPQGYFETVYVVDAPGIAVWSLGCFVLGLLIATRFKGSKNE